MVGVIPLPLLDLGVGGFVGGDGEGDVHAGFGHRLCFYLDHLVEEDFVLLFDLTSGNWVEE